MRLAYGCECDDNKIIHYAVCINKCVANLCTCGTAMMRARAITRWYFYQFLLRSLSQKFWIHLQSNLYIDHHKLRRSSTLFRLRIRCEKYANIIGESMIRTVSMYHSGVCLLYTTGVDDNNNINNRKVLYTQIQTNTHRWYFTREEHIFL